MLLSTQMMDDLSVCLSLATRPILTDSCMLIYTNQDHVDYKNPNELPQIGMEVL